MSEFGKKILVLSVSLVGILLALMLQPVVVVWILAALITFYAIAFLCRALRTTVSATKPIPVDRHVQFTVYRPDRVRPEVWNTLLAFAYRGSDDNEGGADIKNSFMEVERQAAAALGPQIRRFGRFTTENRRDIPRGHSMRFVPRADDLEFNPPEQSLRWVETVHHAAFRFRAPKRLDGTIVHARMEVYIGVVLIAEVGLTIAVDASVKPADADSQTASRGHPYRRIFASYSHRDLSIVKQFKIFADALGDEFMRDWTHLRAGQIWSQELESMIRQADVFQLFWSTNSMESEFVQAEWKYALSLNRASFIRPLYWEDPMPERPNMGLPPDSLRALHFHQLSPVGRKSRVAKSLLSSGRVAGVTVGLAVCFIGFFWLSRPPAFVPHSKVGGPVADSPPRVAGSPPRVADSPPKEKGPVADSPIKDESPAYDVKPKSKLSKQTHPKASTKETKEKRDFDERIEQLDRKLQQLMLELKERTPDLVPSESRPK
jgi:hypothetical protein